MRTFDLDATKWQSVLEFYGAILSSLGAPKGYARNINALLELMVWDEEIEPPFVVRIFGAAKLSKDIRDHVELAKVHLAEACAEFRAREGREIFVAIEVYP